MDENGPFTVDLTIENSDFPQWVRHTETYLPGKMNIFAYPNLRHTPLMWHPM